MNPKVKNEVPQGLHFGDHLLTEQAPYKLRTVVWNTHNMICVRPLRKMEQYKARLLKYKGPWCGAAPTPQAIYKGLCMTFPGRETEFTCQSYITLYWYKHTNTQLNKMLFVCHSPHYLIVTSLSPSFKISMEKPTCSKSWGDVCMLWVVSCVSG